jgi:outer membrane lipoprotein-sorting protein
MFRITSRWTAVVTGVAALCVPALAQEGQAVGKVEAKAQESVKQVLASYKNISALHEVVTLKGNLPDFMSSALPERVEIKIQRPNKLSIVFTQKEGAKKVTYRIVSDGTNLWQWQSDTNVYTKEKAPKLLSEMPQIGNLTPEMEAILFGRNPFEGMPGPNGTMTLNRTEKRGEVEYDVLEASVSEEGAGMSFSLSMLLGQKERLIHGVRLVGKGKDPQGKDISFNLELSYDLVNSKPSFTAADFQFTPPAGSKPATSRSAPSGSPKGR